VSTVITGLVVIIAQVCVVRKEGIGFKSVGALNPLLTRQHCLGNPIFYYDRNVFGFAECGCIVLVLYGDGIGELTLFL